jgi:Flp pilus assembly protein CpaB
MPFDFKKLDKTKLIVLGAAIAAGGIAVFLTNTYINRTIGDGSATKEVAFLIEKVRGLEQANNEIMQRQAAYASRVEEEINNLIQSQKSQAAVNPASESPAQKRQSLALKTPAGKRAITVNIATLAAVGGLLNPGDFVDVLVLLALPTDSLSSNDVAAAAALKNAQKTTVTLFQNIQILAIGANVDSPADFEGQQKASILAITFAVDPQQAELMTFADTYGKLQLVLRSPSERASFRLPSATWDTFKDYLESTQGVSINSPVAPKKDEPKKEPQAPAIEIYRGGTK